MNDQPSSQGPTQMPGAVALETASVVSDRRISPIWIVPLIALAIGGWLLLQSYLNQGPLIYVDFATAEGIVPNETQVKMLSVDLGTVKEVRLNEELNGVTVVAQLVPEASELLRGDTSFWVVRPRIGSAGVSGLSTILSGAYLEMSPGTGNKGARRFKGLDDIPLTAPDTPGVQIELISEDAASISVGTPILYNGFRVGRIESADLDTHIGETRYKAFIDAPYNDLVNTSTRFWDASGVAISAGVSGFNVRTESLESLFTGGVAFGLPEDATAGPAVKSGTLFRLYADYESVARNPYRHSKDYLLFFDSSIRGLEDGAPVEYRGLRIGTVVDVAYDYDGQGGLIKTQDDSAIAVLVRIEPGWRSADSEEGVDELDATLLDGVERGLRASLSIGNLLTGSLYIELDFHEDAAVAEVSELSGFRVFPTVASGLDQIEAKVGGLLTKLQELPLDETLASASSAMQRAGGAMSEADRTLAELTELLAQFDEEQLPVVVADVLVEAREALSSLAPGSPLHSELSQSLSQLQQTLLGAQSVLDNYDKQPNALIFPAQRAEDPLPGGARDP
ncbi:MAG: intermembrane transport protein PqiB [Pseudomonadales bacterium]